MTVRQVPEGGLWGSRGADPSQVQRSGRRDSEHRMNREDQVRVQDHGRHLGRPEEGLVTFAEYFEQVWFPNRDAVVERYTQRAAWSSYTEHIKPFFGHREPRAIS